MENLGSWDMSSTFGVKHDVFVSFRGADTRTNFTSHLLNALTQKSISTFIDYELTRGDYTWPTLARAIEESIVSIVVISENYGSLTWCLKELARILCSVVSTIYVGRQRCVYVDRLMRSLCSVSVVMYSACQLYRAIDDWIGL